MANWIPFTESVQLINGDIFYSTIYGGNLIRTKDGSFEVFHDSEKATVFTPYHFSIHYRNFVLYFPSKSNAYVKYDLRTGKYHTEYIKNGSDEIYLPFMRNDKLEIIGCRTTNRYVYESNGFVFKEKLESDGNWKSIRKNDGRDTICLWNVNKLKVLICAPEIDEKKVYEIKKLDDMSVVYDTTDCIFMSDKNGNIYIYDIETLRLIRCLHYLSDRIISHFEVNEGCLYALYNKGNIITRYLIENEYIQEDYELDLPQDNYTQWVGLSEREWLCVSESMDNSCSKACIVDIYHGTVRELALEEMYCKYQLSVGNIVNETHKYNLSNFISWVVD